MQTLSNVPTLDRYDKTTTLEDDQATLLTYVVANASVQAQFKSAQRQTHGYGSFGPDVLITPEKNVVPQCAGVKFRSAELGKPAQIIAYLLGPTDPQLGAGIPFAAQLKASGGVTQVGGELAYQEYSAAVTLAALTEATANVVVSAPAVVFDGSTVAKVEFYSPDARTPNAETITFVLYEDGASIGQLGVFKPQGTGSVQADAPVKLDREFAPLAGSHTYSIRAFTSAGSPSVRAGAGGSGNLVPGYIRITVAR